MSKFTIKDIVNDSDLNGLILRTGQERMENEITNVNIIDNPDSYDWLSPGDLLLTTGYLFKDSEEMQRKLIRELSEINCAGLAVKIRRYLPQIPPAMLEEAQRLHFPLVEIPVHYPLSRICKSVLERLSGGERDKNMQFVSLYRAITQDILEPGGVDKVIDTLGNFIGNPILLMDTNWSLFSYVDLDDNPIPLGQCLSLQRGGHPLPAELTGAIPQDFAKYTKSVKRTAEFNGKQVICRLFPVADGRVLYGYLLVWETITKMQNIEYSALEIVASTLTMERIKARQMEEMQLHLKQDFFDDLLEGKINSEEAVGSMAGIHNMDVNGSYLCAVTKISMQPAGAEDYVQRQDGMLRLKEKVISCYNNYSREEGRSCISIHRGSLIISFVRVGKNEDSLRMGEGLKSFLRGMFEQGSRIDSSYSFLASVGEPVSRLYSIRRSFLQAQETIRIAESLYGESGMFFYEDLILYQLIDSISGSDRSRELYSLSVADLVEYDKENSTNLVETLEQYFACNCNVSEAAKVLFVHRNTLIYRIDKIKSILNRDLKDSEELLLLQMGLKLLRVQQMHPMDPARAMPK